MKKINKIYLLIVIVSILSFTLKAEVISPYKDSKTFVVKKGGKLIVNIIGGNIKIITWQKNEVRVAVKGNNSVEKFKSLTLSENNNTINVQSSTYKDEIDLEISVPNNFNPNLNTFGGNILVDGNLTGELKAKTSGGNINIDEVNGNVNLITAGGDIRTKAINGNAELTSAGGNFKVGFITGSAKISTAGGNIFLYGIRSKLNLSTAGGNVRVEKVENDVTISTGGGNISVGGIAKNVDLSSGGGNVQLDEATGTIKISTGAGNISVSKGRRSANLTTGAGNIELTLFSVSDNDTYLRTGAGNITLTLPSNSDATITATVKLDKWTIESKDKKKWIISDFPNTTYNVVNDGDRDKIVAVYKLNNGKNNISLTSVYGKIYILKLEK